MSEPLFSITIVNWNGGQHVRRTLESVLQQPAELFELAVVDNGSADGSRQWLFEQLEAARSKGFPNRLTTIGYSSNTGFAKAQNTAISQGKAPWALVLNHDATLSRDFLETAAGAIRRHPEFSMFAVKLYQDGEGRLLDNVGLTFCADGQNRGLAHGQEDRGQFDEPREVFCPSGAAGLYRREALERTGLFDEDYFAYGEDFELGFRLRRAGERCLLVPDASARHVGSASLGKASVRRLRLIERNRIWTLLKHFPWQRIVDSPRVSGQRVRTHWRQAQEGRGVAGAFLKEHGPLEMALTTLRADFDALAGAPKMLWRRGELARSFPLETAQFDNWLERFGVPPEELATGI